MLLQYPSMCINMKLYVSAISRNNSSRIKARKVFSLFLLFIIFFSVLFLNFILQFSIFFLAQTRIKKGKIDKLQQEEKKNVHGLNSESQHNYKGQ